MSKTTTDVTSTDPEDKDTPDAPEGTEEETSTEGDQPEGEGSEESDESDDSENEDDLPEWARKSLKKARNEAANSRVKFRELQTKLEGAKTPDEFAQATKELADSNAALELDLAREKALRKHGLTDDDAVFLTATTAADLEKQAEALAGRIGGGSTDRLRGGLDPTEEEDDTDPGALAKQLRRGPRF